jgi:hypothetical protein
MVGPKCCSVDREEPLGTAHSVGIRTGALLVVAALLHPLHAEAGAVALSLSAGHSNWTYFADGGGLAAAARLDLGIGSVLVIEPGVTVLRLANRGLFGPPKETHRIFELSLQTQARIVPRVYPFVGAGAGIPTDSEDLPLAFHAVVGVRVWMNSHWGARAEFRARDATPLQGDLTGGLSHRF